MELAELANKIEDIVKRKYPRLKLTEEDLAEWILGDAYYRASVNDACRWLVGNLRLSREGKGVAGSPYTYRPYPKSGNFKLAFMSR
jgi:hypothetical protein